MLIFYFFGFYKKIVNSLEKKGQTSGTQGGIHIQPIIQGSKKLDFLLKQLSLYIIEHPRIKLIQEHHTKHIRNLG